MPDPLPKVYESKTAPPFRPPKRSLLDALDPMQSLRVRAAVIFGVMPVLFTLAFAYIAKQSLMAQVGDQIGPNLSILSTQVADKLDRAIWARFNEIQIAATLQPIRLGTEDERRRMLTTIATSSPNYVWLAYIDKDGVVTASSRGLAEGTNVDERTWYRSGRQSPFASSLHNADGLGTEPPTAPNPHYLDIVAPVFAGGGTSTGVVAGRLDWAVAQEVEKSVIPESTRRTRLDVTIYNARGEVLLDSGGSGWADPPDMPAVPENEKLRGSFWEAHDDGSLYLTGYAHTAGYREFRALDLLVCVRQQGSELLAPAVELQNRILSIGFGLAALSAIGGWFTGWQITRRLNSITRSAYRLKTGDLLTVMPRFKGNDETAKMAEAVADLTEALRSRSKDPERPMTFREKGQ